MSLDRMTIRTPHFALYNLALRLSDALGVTDIDLLVIANVVKVKCVWMLFVSAVNTAVRQLMSIQPTPDRGGSLIGLPVEFISILRIRQTLDAPSLCFLRFIRPVAGPAVRLGYFIWVALTPPLACFAAPRLLLRCPSTHHWRIA